MWDEQKGAWTGSGGSPKEKGGRDKERRKGEGGAGPRTAPRRIRPDEGGSLREVTASTGRASSKRSLAINAASVAVARGGKGRCA